VGKFDKFKISADNKKVARQQIEVDLLIPSTLTAGLHPVIARFHGGGYVRSFIFKVLSRCALPNITI
jgi:hypothetical protein